MSYIINVMWKLCNFLTKTAEFLTFNQGNKISAKQTLFFTADIGNVLQYKKKRGTRQPSVLSTKNKTGLSMLVSTSVNY